MDIEGLKKEFAKSMLSQATEEYNKLDYIDKIDNNLILTGLFTYNMMDCLMNGKIATEPTKSVARLMKIMTAMEKKEGKGLLESEEHAQERIEKAKARDESMKIAGVIKENDPAAFEAMLNGDKEAVQYISEYIDNLNSIDPETYAEMEQAREQGDWNTYETRYAQCIKDARLYENLSRLYGINPEVYNDMAYVGGEFENNKTADMLEISQNSDLEARLTRLENTLSEYIQMQQGIDPQTQARAGEEKDDKARAIYEKDGVRIEVAKGLEVNQEQELQHGQEFNQAAEEVTEEDLEQADKEVKERDAITEDGTTQIILANSKKITITVEPYVAGDKETQMAQEANEQEKIAAKDSNTEITNDTARI